ncbi:MAG TPA: hypothetical protein VI039_11045 [Solirubrobacterales bacterium]
MDLTELVGELNDAPSQREPVFPFHIRGIVVGREEQMLDACQRILDMPESELQGLRARDVEEVRFLALYILLLVNWREFNYPRYRELVDLYAADFAEEIHPYFLTFRSQYHSSHGDDLDEVERALEYACMAAERLPEGPAVLHLMAATTAKVSEAGGQLTDEQFAAADQAIRTAIRLDRDLLARNRKPTRFARYHATRARLLTLQGRHREARGELHKALELEDPRATSRIAEYLEIRGQISLNESVGPVREELESLSRRIEEETESLRTLSTEVADQIRLQSVQLLGLLAAVLAFLFTGAEIARNLDFDEATKLMAVVAGTILVVFSGFSLIFYAERLTGRRLAAGAVAVMLGAVLMAVGLVA